MKCSKPGCDYKIMDVAAAVTFTANIAPVHSGNDTPSYLSGIYCGPLHFAQDVMATLPMIVPGIENGLQASEGTTSPIAQLNLTSTSYNFSNAPAVAPPSLSATLPSDAPNPEPIKTVVEFPTKSLPTSNLFGEGELNAILKRLAVLDKSKVAFKKPYAAAELIESVSFAEPPISVTQRIDNMFTRIFELEYQLTRRFDERIPNMIEKMGFNVAVSNLSKIGHIPYSTASFPGHMSYGEKTKYLKTESFSPKLVWLEKEFNVSSSYMFKLQPSNINKYVVSDDSAVTKVFYIIALGGIRYLIQDTNTVSFNVLLHKMQNFYCNTNAGSITAILADENTHLTLDQNREIVKSQQDKIDSFSKQIFSTNDDEVYLSAEFNSLVKGFRDKASKVEEMMKALFEAMLGVDSETTETATQNEASS